MIKKFALAIAIAAMAVGSAQAGAVGSLAFADLGTASADTGNINTATTFGIGDLVSTSGSGVFAGLPLQFFGPVSFSTSVGTSLSFSDAAFGSFSSTSISEVTNTPGFVTIYVLGNYTAGSYDAGASGAASFRISYTQTPVTTGAISDSATFSIPPAGGPSTPEPATVFGLISGVAAFAFVRLRRKA